MLDGDQKCQAVLGSEPSFFMLLQQLWVLIIIILRLITLICAYEFFIFILGNL